MLQIKEGMLQPRRSSKQTQRDAIRHIREACLRQEKGIGRPIDNLNDIQRALDGLYEVEWERRKKEG